MIIDTHAHLDVEDYSEDLPEVIARAKEAGVKKIFIPSIDLATVDSVIDICNQYPGYCYPMIGLHPEEVKGDYTEVLRKMKLRLNGAIEARKHDEMRIIAVGEVGLDFYWSREFEKEQILVFEEMMQWSMEKGLPLMIHCRKAQNEMIHQMKPYMKELPGGVFHCFTGNIKEAEDFLQFDKFSLGVGGVATFKSSHLREDLPKAVPLNRLVLETDSPYMAPAPFRGNRNESAYVARVWEVLADAYKVSKEELAAITNNNVKRIFPCLLYTSPSPRDS